MRLIGVRPVALLRGMRIGKCSRRTLALLLGLVAAVALAELACRIDALFPGTRYDKETARLYFEARATPQAAADMQAYGRPDPQLSEKDALPFVHPYAGWSNARTDDLAAGFARETARPDDRFDLLLLGGSVAGNFASLGIPRLTELLEADPRLGGRKVRVWSFARPSYRAPQPLGWCSWLLDLGAKPDAVLLVDGFNEVAMSLENARRGLHPAYPSFHYWSGLLRGVASDPAVLDLVADIRIARREQIAIASRARDLGFHRSAILTRIAQARIAAARVDVDAATGRLRAYQDAHAGEDAALRGPPFAGDDKTAVAVAVQGWAGAARTLHAICAERGIACLQVVQPTLLDPGAKRASADEARVPEVTIDWTEAVAIGYPRLRERARVLAGEGRSVVDATGAFADVEETLFDDVVHLNARGNVLLAEWIAPRMLDALAR